MNRTIKFRSFRRSVDGYGMETCQDAMAVSRNGRRFAVSDGVSASYRPDILARLLVESYVEPPTATFEMEESLLGGVGEDIARRWLEQADADEEAADGRRKWLLRNSRKRFGFAAATFAGISVGDRSVAYEVLGDSAVFFFPGNGDASIRACVDIDPEADAYHPLKSVFGNAPQYFDTNCQIYGSFLRGEEVLESGVVVLATDAVAEWLANNYDIGNGDALKEILSLESEQDYDDFLGRHRPAEMHNDDATLIIVEIGEANMSAIDVFPWLRKPYGEGITALLEPHRHATPPQIPENYYTGEDTLREESAEESAKVEFIDEMKRKLKNIFKWKKEAEE